MSLERITENYGHAPAEPPASPVRRRRLKAAEISFVANPLFEHPDAANIILKVLPQEAVAHAQATVTAGTNPKAADVFIAQACRAICRRFWPTCSVSP